MTIKDVEEITGLARSNIRFYEKEELIRPERNGNGYRNYSEKDVALLKKIAWLRTLGISVEDIRNIINHQVSLKKVIQIRAVSLKEEMTKLETVKVYCERLLQDGETDFDNLDVEAYTPDLKEHWDKNKKIFRLDSVSFFYLWGRTIIWGLITASCFCVAVVAFYFLPEMIPIQWNQGEVSQTASKWIIFAYPASCAIARFLLRPFIINKLWKSGIPGDSITDYIVNFLCLLALLIEIFTMFNLQGNFKHVEIWIIVSILLFVGVLLLVWNSMDNNGKMK